jgi:hypothetical protein
VSTAPSDGLDVRRRRHEVQGALRCRGRVDGVDGAACNALWGVAAQIIDTLAKTLLSQGNAALESAVVRIITNTFDFELTALKVRPARATVLRSDARY